MRRTAVALGALLALADGAVAQRAGESATRAAEDAFGTALGREQLGLYDEEEVRGFSPLAAGNLRLDGLYFDGRAEVSERLRDGYAVRVGPAALGYPFPAPSGIVDYALRKPGAAPVRNATLGGSSVGDLFLEADIAQPLHGDRLGLQLGGALGREVVGNGSATDYGAWSALARWRPREGVEVLPFWSWLGADDQSGTILVPDGAFRPPRGPRRARFDGPDWARSRYTEQNGGVITRAELAEGWSLAGGLFRSVYHSSQSFTNLLLEARPDGTGRREIIADPAYLSASWSGELRATRTFAEVERRHLLTVSLRGRHQHSRYGGSDALDLGPGGVGVAPRLARPDFRFGPRTRDEVVQGSLGLSYELRWAQVGELTLGLQRTDYRKDVTLPGAAPTSTRDAPFLLNASGALAIAPRLALYGGYAQGLEESGEVPDTAANRLALLPAVRTTQLDAGLRWLVTPALRLLAGVFRLERPYLAEDAAGVFAPLGDLRQEGIELSLAGEAAPGLSLVAGAVLSRPRVSGAAVADGRLGDRPVGAVERLAILNLDWAVPRLPGLSLDLALRHTGPRVATADNGVVLPARTVLDLGARYRFVLNSRPATLRVQLTNATDSEVYEVVGSGAYLREPGRAVLAYLSTEF